MRALREAGYQALLAGGCVRDWLLGRVPADWDIATDAAPEQVMALFARTVPVGRQFGIVRVVLEEGHYEVARFRRDGPYEDGRHPRQVAFSSPEEDARRRDFTINGLFYDPLEERLIDYVGGRADIERGLVRAIGDPRQRFGEDYLRMLRAVRFAARLGFAVDGETLDAIADQAPGICRVSAERVRDELTRMLTEGGAARGALLLMECGLMHQVLPEVAAMDGVAQPPEFHPEGDVWTHVLLMLEKMENPSPALAWGALLHDVGKPPTFQVRDRIRFDNHDRVGAEMAEAIGRRLRLDNDLRQRIVDLVAQHMRFANVRRMRESRLRRFLRQPLFAELLELHRLDCLASHGKLDLYAFCAERRAELGREQLQPPRLLGGADLVELGLEPGPLFGEILRRVEDEQLEGRIASRTEALAFVRGWLAGERPERGSG